MQVNLRKADKLYHAIVAVLASIQTPLEVSITEFEDPETVIENARKEWGHVENVRSHLYGAMLEIRTKVGEANAASGVNEILTEIANIEAKLKYREKLYGNAHTTADMGIIKGRLQNIRDVPAAERRRGYMDNESIRVSIISEDMLKSMTRSTANLRKRREALKDALLTRNVETTIELSEQVVTALKAVDIV